MASYTQTGRPMAIKTPLGDDVLLLTGLRGQEGLSRLFRYELTTICERTRQVAIDDLLGKSITVRLDVTVEEPRFINGICSRISHGESDADFTEYRLEIVPKLWLLSRTARSRIFQPPESTVPQIVKKVLQGIEIEDNIQGTFHPRDYCVQYRETDLNFISRVMEEEGIFYFFKHEDGQHKMVLANTPSAHADMPVNKDLVFQKNFSGPTQEDPGRIIEWTKHQELRSGKVTLWDYCFEKPDSHLDASRDIQQTVAVGQVTHKLTAGPNNSLELYDFPGAYAQRFDGVDKGGGEKPADIEKIFEDNARTAGIRMQQEAAQAILIEGRGTCRQLVAGHKFTLSTLPGGETASYLKADGSYVLTEVAHAASQSDYRSDAVVFRYENSFTCIPDGLPYRPPRETAKPVVEGTQTAVVVGPAGEEIFTDKYGRVKVQFHWDREGKKDAGSSCWVRVAQVWAGKRWGAFFWPRIGQEVIVAFEEGDPDQPIIIGSVYNAQQMPPYLGNGPDDKHKNDNKVSGIKTNTTKGGEGFNELRFDDTKDKQQVFIHAERNMDVRVKNDSMEQVLHDRHLIVGREKDGKKEGDQRELVHQDKHLHVLRNQVEHIEGNYGLLVGKGKAVSGGNLDVMIAKDKKEKIDGAQHLTIAKARNVKIGGDHSLTVGGARQEKVGTNYNVEAGATMHIKSGATLVIEAGAQLSLKVGGNFIDINPAGVFIQGTMVMINSGGAAGRGAGAKPTEPQAPKEASPTKPTEADDAKTGSKSC